MFNVNDGDIIKHKETGNLYMLGFEEYVFVGNEKEENCLPHLVIDIENGSVYDSYISRECVMEDYILTNKKVLIE